MINILKAVVDFEKFIKNSKSYCLVYKYSREREYRNVCINFILTHTNQCNNAYKLTCLVNYYIIRIKNIH